MKPVALLHHVCRCRTSSTACAARCRTASKARSCSSANAARTCRRSCCTTSSTIRCCTSAWCAHAGERRRAAHYCRQADRMERPGRRLPAPQGPLRLHGDTRRASAAEAGLQGLQGPPLRPDADLVLPGTEVRVAGRGPVVEDLLLHRLIWQRRNELDATAHFGTSPPTGWWNWMPNWSFVPAQGGSYGKSGTGSGELALPPSGRRGAPCSVTLAPGRRLQPG